MQRTIFSVLIFLAICSIALGQVQLTNLDQKSFIIDVTGQPTNVVNLHLRNTQFSSSTTGWVLTNISGVYGGSTNITTNSIWGIDGFGNITPVVTNNAVIATNIVRYGVGRMFGTESWLSKAITLTNGPNYLGAAENSQFFLIGPTTNPADCQIILSNAVATGQKLVLVNQTNAIPAEGAWHLTNNTPIPDGAGVVKLLGGFDLLSTNGYISYFEFISPDWQEVGRILASGASGLLTNVFNNIVVYSNITLKGNSTLTINNITVTTNDLWKTNIFGTVTNLLPVDPTVYVQSPRGFMAGTNTVVAVNNALASTRDSHFGELNANGISIISRDSATVKEAEFTVGGSVLGGYSLEVSSRNLTNIWDSALSVNAAFGADFYIGTNGIGGLVKYIDLNPSAADGSPIATIGSWLTHTSGNLFEIANNETNWWTFGISGAGTIAELGLHSQSGDLSSIRATNGINFNIDVAGGYQWRMNGIGFEPEFDGSTLASNLHPINGGHFNNVIWGDGGAGVADTSGNGSPEGVAAAAVGSVWRNTNGAPGTTLYVKETGVGNTGWTAIGAGGGGGTVGTIVTNANFTTGDLYAAGTSPTNAVKATSGDVTNAIGYMVVNKAGDTVTGPLLSSSSTTNGPAANEFATGNWVRNLLSSGTTLYGTTNADNGIGFTGAITNTTTWVADIPPNGSVTWTSAQLGVSTNFANLISTQRFVQVSGPLSIFPYLMSTGGNAASSYTIHSVLYYTYDKTNLLGGYSSGSQTLLHGASTNAYAFTIGFPTIVATNTTGFYIVRRMVVDAKTGTGDDLTFAVGTNSPSHISLTIPAAVGANWVASGATNSTLAGVASVNALVSTNGLTSPVSTNALLLGASGTNFWMVATNGDLNPIGLSARSIGSAGLSVLNFTASGTVKGGTVSGQFLTDSANTKGYMDTSVAGYNFIVNNRVNTNVNMTIDAKASQTADLLQFRSSGGTPLTTISVGGNLTAISTVETLGTLTFNATNEIDVASGVSNYRTVTLGGDWSPHSTNRAAGHWFTAIITGASTNCALTLPAWHFMSQTAPTTLVAAKKATLTVLFVDTVETNAIANYAVEP